MIQLLPCHVLIVIRNLKTKVTASRMNYNIKISDFISVTLNEVIASTQCSQRTAGIPDICLTAADPIEFNFINKLMNVTSSTNLTSDRNIAANTLIKLFRIKVLTHRRISFDNKSLHSTSDINTYKIRADFVGNRHGRSNRTTCTGVYVRHHADFTVSCIRLVAETLNLNTSAFFKIVSKNLSSVVLSLYL